MIVDEEFTSETLHAASPNSYRELSEKLLNTGEVSAETTFAELIEILAKQE
jgi:hypothetical protein